MKSIPPNSRTVPAVLVGISAAAAVAVIGASVQDLLATGTIPDLRLLFFSPFLWLFAFGVFLMGFVMPGVPTWVAAHFLGRTHWYDGVIIGAFLASISEFLFTYPSRNSSGSAGGIDLVVNGHFTHAGWLNALELAGIMACAGAAAGLTIWRRVYGSCQT